MVKVSIYWFILTSGESCATQRELSQWLNNQWLLLFNQWLVSNNALTLFVCWVPNKWEKVRTFHPMKFYSLLNKLIQSKRIRPMKPKHWLLEKYYRVCKCQGRCLSDHRWEEGKVSQGLFKGEGVVCIRKGITKTKTSGGPRKAPLDTVSQTILDLHEDSTNLMGSVGVVGLGGLIITGKHCSQLNVYIYFFKNKVRLLPISA